MTESLFKQGIDVDDLVAISWFAISLENHPVLTSLSLFLQENLFKRSYRFYDLDVIHEDIISR